MKRLITELLLASATLVLAAAASASGETPLALVLIVLALWIYYAAWLRDQLATARRDRDTVEQAWVCYDQHGKRAIDRFEGRRVRR